MIPLKTMLGYRFQFSSTWVRMQTWTCLWSLSSMLWQWEPVLEVSSIKHHILRWEEDYGFPQKETSFTVLYTHQGFHSLFLCERCGSFQMASARRRHHMLRVTATFCTAVSLRREVTLCFLSEPPRALKSVCLSQAPAHPGSVPFSAVALFVWEGHEELRERAVRVFQLNQLHCDSSLSIHSMMSPPPSSIPELTPLEMWGLLSCSMDIHHNCQGTASHLIQNSLF